MKNKRFTILFAVLMATVVGLPFSIIAKPKAPAPKAKHVVFIGMDGWGGYSLPEADMPIVKGLMENGAWTLRKRAVIPSRSAINWASLFMGVGPEFHGYTKWNSKSPELPSSKLNEHGIFPTIFSETRKTYPQAETGVLYEWDGIKHLVDTLAVSHHDGDIDYGKHPTQLSDMASEYIKTKKPMLLAVVFDNPDHVGHGKGYASKEYYDILKTLDVYVGNIINATKEAGIYDDTVFILTSDHGGIKNDHGGVTTEEMNTPLIIFGPGVPVGEITDPVNQADVSAIMADILNVPIPKEWRGVPVVKINGKK